MKLQRWNVGRGGLDTADVFDDHGEWVRWADVLAWRDSIRAAVVAERAAVDELIGRALFPPEGAESYRLDKAARIGVRRANRALDALLTDGGA